MFFLALSVLFLLSSFDPFSSDLVFSLFAVSFCFSFFLAFLFSLVSVTFSMQYLSHYFHNIICFQLSIKSMGPVLLLSRTKPQWYLLDLAKHSHGSWISLIKRKQRSWKFNLVLGIKTSTSQTFTLWRSFKNHQQMEVWWRQITQSSNVYYGWETWHVIILWPLNSSM